MNAKWLFITALILLFNSTLVLGQFAETPKQPQGEGENGASLGEPQTLKWRCGIELTGGPGGSAKIVATSPIPVSWPEQELKLLEEEVSPGVHAKEKKLFGGVEQMIISVPRLPSGAQVKAVRVYEIKAFPQFAPDNTETYKKPEKSDYNATLRTYLSPSPLIESRDPKITGAAKTIGLDAKNAWEEVEAIYDWVRNHVKYENGKIKGALAALKDGTGDCEELTSLFIAICRAKGYPARTVWVPGHCYPEFYLIDKTGKGVWFPCQIAGTRAFGELPEGYIILQKGDSFPSAESPRKKVRYLPESVQGEGGRPRARFIREKVD